jgi:hypothetical protein
VKNMTDTNKGLGSKKMDPQTKHDIQSKGGQASSTKQTGAQSSSMKPNMPKQAQQPVTKVKETLSKVADKAGAKGGAAMMGTAAGVVVGAAVGGLAGRALTDKDTRDALSELSKKAADLADNISEKATELSEKTDKVTSQLAHDARELEEKTNRN